MKKFNFIFVLLFVATLTSCADFFQSKIPMDFEAGSANLEDLIVQKTKGGKLGTPKQVIASQYVNSSSINLTWTAVPDAISYRIECAIVTPDKNGKYEDEAPEAIFTVLEEAWYGTKYEHKIAGYGQRISDYNKRYYYRIFAINNRDGFDEGDPTGRDTYGTLFAPPTNVVASAGISEEFISVSWNPVKGATSYDILRTENPSGAGAGYLGTVAANLNSYKDLISKSDMGKEFYYIVYANNKESQSAASNVAMGYSLVEGAPSAPSGVSITEGRGKYSDKIKLTWGKVQNKEPVSYNIFRYNSKDAQLTRVGNGLKQTEFVDTKSLEPGIYYYYLIQTEIIDPISKKKLKSAFSTPVEGYILSAPNFVEAEKASGGVTLIWDKAIGTPEEQEKYTYAVYISNDLNGEYTELRQIKDTTLTGGDALFYKVVTINADGVKSEPSKIASPAPDAATFIKVTKADYSILGENPTPNDGGVYPVKITWKKPSNDIPYGYHVYRSTKPNEGYRKISNNVILFNGPESSYIDRDNTLKAGKVYYYKVQSVNALEQGKNDSEVAYGWGALTHERYLLEYNKTVVSSQRKLSLMHKPGNTDKLGSETANGAISGTLYYNAKVVGLGAEITMKYTDYADFYINDDPNLGIEFKLNGNSNTKADMSSNGTMNSTVTCEGMYPGSVDYSTIKIVSGNAGGGTYGVTPKGYTKANVPYSVLED